MTTDQLTPSQRDASRLFLEGQGWGFGGSVDVEAIDPWNVPGRYGWVGGTGTAAHITPSTGAVTILLSQLELAGPDSPALMPGLLAARRERLKPEPGQRPGPVSCRLASEVHRGTPGIRRACGRAVPGHTWPRSRRPGT